MEAPSGWKVAGARCQRKCKLSMNYIIFLDEGFG
jgi:hypothetical protein